jgi:hypothetical protein
MNATSTLLQGYPVTVGLAYRDVYVLAEEAEVRVSCLRGCLWLTLDHDRRDIVLEAGEGCTVPAGARCLVCALEASDLRRRAAVARAPDGVEARRLATAG